MSGTTRTNANTLSTSAAGLDRKTLRALLGISKALTAHLEPRHLLQRLAEETSKLMGAEGVLVLLRLEHGRMRIEVCHGFPQEFTGRIIPAGRPDRNRELIGLGEPFGWPAFLGGPLLVDKRLRGLLCVYTAGDAAEIPAEALLDLLADLAATALKNALLFEQANLGRETMAETLAVVFHQVPEGLLFLDKERRIILASPTALHWLGLNEIPGGILFHDLVHLCRLAFPKTSVAPSFLDQFLPDHGVAGLAIHVGRTKLDLELGVYGINDQEGRPSGTIIFLRNLTYERRFVKRREDFLSTAAHDMRAPLAAISSYLQLLKRPDYLRQPRKVEQALAAMERNIVSMSKICQDLLEISRLAAGNLPLKLSRIDLAGLAQAVLEEQRILFAQKEVEIDAEIESAKLVADPQRLHQVLSNLLGNALKFSQPGQHVRLRIWQESGMACLSVADQGPGIPADKLNEVFQPYYQAENIPKSNGVGLGLAIVKGVAEAHHGSISVTSQPGEGATFTVRIPIDQDFGDTVESAAGKEG